MGTGITAILAHSLPYQFKGLDVVRRPALTRPPSGANKPLTYHPFVGQIALVVFGLNVVLFLSFFILSLYVARIGLCRAHKRLTASPSVDLQSPLHSLAVNLARDAPASVPVALSRLLPDGLVNDRCVALASTV